MQWLHAVDTPIAGELRVIAGDMEGDSVVSWLKTLMAEVDGKPVCAVVPADCEVSMKKLADAFDGKAANMMRPADAERLTGYHVGGISPFGQKKKVPVAIEATALNHLTVFVNGGQRGLQIEIDPNDAAIAAGAVAHALTA